MNSEFIIMNYVEFSVNHNFEYLHILFCCLLHFYWNKVLAKVSIDNTVVYTVLTRLLLTIAVVKAAPCLECVMEIKKIAFVAVLHEQADEALGRDILH